MGEILPSYSIIDQSKGIKIEAEGEVETLCEVGVNDVDNVQALLL